MVAAFTQDQGVCEGSESGRDMDGATTGKVETGKIEKPAVRIPCPIGDGAVDREYTTRNQRQWRARHDRVQSCRPPRSLLHRPLGK